MKGSILLSISIGLLFVIDPGVIAQCMDGDLNCDLVVNIFDLVIVAQDFGKASGFDPRADPTTDGIVNIFDLVLVATNFGKTGSCECTDWSDVGCGGACGEGFMQQQRSCSSAGCDEEQRCTYNPGCGTAKAGGIWISKEEIMALPASGEYWNKLKSAADSVSSKSVVCSHSSDHDVYTMAAALVAARLEDPGRLQQVAAEIMRPIEKRFENNCKSGSLSLTRSLPGYIIAADVIDLKSLDPAKDAQFRDWLEYVVYVHKIDGATQVDKHYKANNHGTQAAVVRMAAALYLGKQSDFALAAESLKDWLGMSAQSFDWNWGELCWQADPNNPVGINPKGATLVIDGASRNVDGVLPDEQRRQECKSSFTWPPMKQNYVYGGLQGLVGQYVILSRNGYPDVWEWEDRALLRAYEWVDNVADYPATGDDTWQLPIIDKAYSTNYWDGSKTEHGKQLGWTDWTHQ